MVFGYMVVQRLQARLSRESEAGLHRGMHFPTRWDPCFRGRMSLADVYRYPGRHFDHHARQLTVTRPDRRLRCGA